MTEQISIQRRFQGPPNSGHGGYVCGIVANFIGPCAEVTLRSPPPLDLPLSVERMESGEVGLFGKFPGMRWLVQTLVWSGLKKSNF